MVRGNNPLPRMILSPTGFSQWLLENPWADVSTWTRDSDSDGKDVTIQPSFHALSGDPVLLSACRWRPWILICRLCVSKFLFAMWYWWRSCWRGCPSSEYIYITMMQFCSLCPSVIKSHQQWANSYLFVHLRCPLKPLFPVLSFCFH
jgi:hypothetical protein